MSAVEWVSVFNTLNKMCRSDIDGKLPHFPARLVGNSFRRGYEPARKSALPIFWLESGEPETGAVVHSFKSAASKIIILVLNLIEMRGEDEC